MDIPLTQLITSGKSLWGGRPRLRLAPLAGPWWADEGVRRGPGGPPHSAPKQALAESRGYPDVRIPGLTATAGEFWIRVPDVVVSSHKPRRIYSLGHPPELVIEILSTRRGNIERTEKIEDYAWAGIGEYCMSTRSTASWRCISCDGESDDSEGS